MNSDRLNFPEELYLDLLKKCLTRYIFGESYWASDPPRGSIKRFFIRLIQRFLAFHQLELVKRFTFDAEQRLRGSDYPPEAETMMGLKRLDNLQHCITDVLSKGVPGDLIEAGVWRGGGAIFMRAVLKAFGDNKRIVWVADSFQGLPKPDGSRYPADAGDSSWKSSYFAVPVDQVKANFIDMACSMSKSGFS